MGPYESEADARAEPLPQEVRELHRKNLVRSGDPERVTDKAAWRHLTAACEAAGVKLGAFDRRILGWLCGWEPETVQVVIGIISRANNGRN